MIVTHTEREAETQVEGEAGSMQGARRGIRSWVVGFDPGSPGSRPGPKAGAKPLRHPGIPPVEYLLSSEITAVFFFSQPTKAKSYLRQYYTPRAWLIVNDKYVLNLLNE